MPSSNPRSAGGYVVNVVLLALGVALWHAGFMSKKDQLKAMAREIAADVRKEHGRIVGLEGFAAAIRKHTKRSRASVGSVGKQLRKAGGLHNGWHQNSREGYSKGRVWNIPAEVVGLNIAEIILDGFDLRLTVDEIWSFQSVGCWSVVSVEQQSDDKHPDRLWEVVELNYQKLNDRVGDQAVDPIIYEFAEAVRLELMRQESADLAIKELAQLRQHMASIDK
jgi:hypothetical protein